MAALPNYDRSVEDLGNITALEHVNVTIPDQRLATVFYVMGMGFTRDPYLNVGDENMWANVGSQQFHLPTRKAQIIDGHVGVVVPDLEALESRLQGVADGLKESKFSFQRNSRFIEVTCPWGNRYRCHPSQPGFGDMTLGIPYIEFSVKPGAAKAIVSFYREAFGVPAAVESDPTGSLGRVKIGRSQCLIFRETERAIAQYDGHHIAVYVANFSGPYKYLTGRNLISEDVRNHQFRFRDIIDPESGNTVFLLEHEVRSLRHPMYHRPFVNRDPAQSQRAYHRGWDAFVPFQR